MVSLRRWCVASTIRGYSSSSLQSPGLQFLSVVNSIRPDRNHLNMITLYFFFIIILTGLDSGCTYNKEEVETKLPVIYPSYLYLTVPPKKVLKSINI